MTSKNTFTDSSRRDRQHYSQSDDQQLDDGLYQQNPFDSQPTHSRNPFEPSNQLHLEISSSVSDVDQFDQFVDENNNLPQPVHPLSSPGNIDSSKEKKNVISINTAASEPITRSRQYASLPKPQSHSTPASSKPTQIEAFKSSSLPMKPPIVSPKRSRGMSLRSQLLNKTLEHNLKAALQKNDIPDDYTENIELQGGVNRSENSSQSQKSRHGNWASSPDSITSIISQSSDASSPSTSFKSASRKNAHQRQGSTLSSKKTPPFNRKPQKTYSINRLIETVKYNMGLSDLKPTIGGRKVPLTLEEFDFETFASFNPNFAGDFKPTDIKYHYNGSEHVLVDERASRPYVNNKIVSSRYNLLNFLPKQLYAQFSKIANIYFMTIAIMQLVPNWSTTGTTTTIIPLSIFISISIAREGIDDLRRHAQDKEENNKQITLILKGPIKAQRQLLDREALSRNSMVSKISGRSANSVTKLNADFNDTTLPGSGKQQQPSRLKNSDFIIGEDGEDDDNTNISDRDRTLTSTSNVTAGRNTNENNQSPNANTFNKTFFLNKADLYEKKIQWKNLRVGSVVKLGQDEPVPADMIILTSDNPNSEVFVETMDLDGETNLKTKLPHAQLNEVCNNAQTLSNINGIVTTEDPNRNLYNFEGHLILGNEKYPLTNDNIVYRGSVIRNTGCVLGLVIFSGEESKIRMNAIKNPRTKAPHLQKYINMIVMFMICIVVALSVGSFIAQRTIFNHIKNRHWYILSQDVGAMPTFMSFIIMYNTLIPLSLYVTMELIKVAQLLFLQCDIDLYYPPTNTPAEAKTATILEELGQVSYIFSDKTGTLTDNLMIFRKFSVAGVPWIHDLDMVLKEIEENDPDAKRPSMLSPMLNANAPPSHSPPVGGLGLLRRSTDLIGKDHKKVSFDGDSYFNSNDIRRSGDAKGSLDIKRGSIDIRRGTGTSHYSGRPSMASVNIKQFTSPVSRSKTAIGLISGKPQADHHTLDSYSLASSSTSASTHLRSSIELINYIQTNPDCAYSKKAVFFMLSLALCHTCFPKKISNNNDNGGYSSSDEVSDDVEYQSSSPDELALVTAARDMGFMVFDKKQNTLVLKTYPNGLDQDPLLENYEILDVIEFNSVRKRMSCIVKFPNGRKCLICKGADNVILQRLGAAYNGTEVAEKIAKNAKLRKEAEANYLIQERASKSIDLFRNNSIKNIAKNSLSISRASKQINNNMVNDMLFENERRSTDIDRIVENSRKSLHLDQQKRYGLNSTEHQNHTNQRSNQVSPNVGGNNSNSPLSSYITDDSLIENRQYVVEKTLEHIDEFSTDGLRTLLYGYKWLGEEEYNSFSSDYYEAKTALVDRQEKMEQVGERLETELELCGATAIEDKLQEGVPDAIDKIHRAGIKMWMLTGDKRETAINIGYSCGLIKNASTVVVLSNEEDDDPALIAKMEAAVLEIKNQNVAHCVLVIDGSTLTLLEHDVTMMSMFIEFGCVADAVICCRASPSQKAKLVTVVKEKYKNQVTLAIGDGANDIAMIQSADIGIGITGKEGLQAARSSDYSIAQFKFLIKLLFVHGRYNYVRTTKFILFTFYKEFMFYLSQAIFQRNALFTGTSLYEPWSLSMFNTLFTSLPVLCIGIVEKDLRPATLIANPGLYRQGRENLSFNLPIFIYWMAISTATSVMITMLSWKLWGETSLIDNTLLPMGVLTFIVFVILINVKCQMLDMRNRNAFAFASVIIESVGVIIWNFLIAGLYKEDTSVIYYAKVGITQEFGTDPTWWATLVLLLTLGLLVDVIIKVMRNWLLPTSTDYFQEFEKSFTLRQRFEQLAYSYLQQSWEFDPDKSFQKLRSSKFGQKVFLNKGGDDNAKDAVTSGANASDSSSMSTSINGSQHSTTESGTIDKNDPRYMLHVLPSGKVHRERIIDSKFTKLGKKMGLVSGHRGKREATDGENGIQGEVIEEEEEDADKFISEVMRQRHDSEGGMYNGNDGVDKARVADDRQEALDREERMSHF